MGRLRSPEATELERCLDFMRPKGRVVHPNGIEPVPMARPTFRVRAFDAVANSREFDASRESPGNRIFTANPILLRER